MHEDGSKLYTFINTFNIENVNYTLNLSFDGNSGLGCVFDYSHYLFVHNSAITFFNDFVNGSLGGSSSSSSTSPFIVSDLDGNFGAYAKGTVVNVTSRPGDFVVEASQIFWAFPHPDFQGSSFIYRLSQDGKVLYAPDFILSLKAAS